MYMYVYMCMHAYTHAYVETHRCSQMHLKMETQTFSFRNELCRFPVTCN